jgi:hypothetical protein
MKNWIKLLVICCFVLAGCTEKKEKEVDPVEKTMGISLEGMWKLKSGVWENADGTFLKFPEDSITEGEAYIIRSKTHYMLVGVAPKMNLYRGELISYAVDGDKITVNTQISNLDESMWFKNQEWTFTLEGKTMTAHMGNNKEIWEKVD